MNSADLKAAAKLIKAMTQNKLKTYQPYEKQREFHNNGALSRERCFLAANQPQPMDAEIQTPFGPTAMGWLKEGQRVLAGDGTSTEVVAILPQGPLPCYQLTFDDGSVVECALDHKWPVVHPANRWRKRQDTDMRLADIVALDGLDPSPQRRVSIDLAPASQFDVSAELHVDPYSLGALLGDGTLSGKYPSITCGDIEILETIQRRLPESQSTRLKEIKPNNYLLAFHGGTKSFIYTHLDKLHLMYTKSATKFIPDDYLFASIEDRKALLRGLNDTDGSIGDSGQVEYLTVSPRLANDYCRLVESLGGAVKIKQRLPWFTYKGERKLGQLAYRIMTRKMPFNPFSLDRKASRWQPGTRAMDRVLRNIEFVGHKEMQCITVSHGSNTYLTDHFIRTCNSGKTLSAGYETAMHATGRYPDWWGGKRFDGATRGWVAGTSGEGTRDTVQRILLGEGTNYGTGTIPKSAIKEVKMSRGTAGAVGQIFVHHVSGNVSYIGFRTYEQELDRWAGESLHYLWCDEEPPADHYSEGLTRLNARGGIAYSTLTPLLGMTKFVHKFYPEPTTLDRALTMMTVDDVGHFTDNEKEQIYAAYSPHEREARMRGIPMLGSGRVFPIPRSKVEVVPFEIPAHWPLLGGIDFGWDHPTGCVAAAWDRDADCIYITHGYRESERTPSQMAVEVKEWNRGMPWAWPHDGNRIGDRGTNLTEADMYRREGLRMLRSHATFEDGGHSFEAGLLEMLQRMQSGRLKVFHHLEDWFAEFDIYHRKDGKVVKEVDDLMSATRMVVMAKRFAKCREEQHKFPRTIGGDNYDPFSATA